jgi:hypothetical protein
MKSLKDIANEVTRFNVNPRSEMRSKVFDEALEIQRNQKQRSTSDTYTWRTIMRSRRARFAAAAVAVLATYLCLQIPKSLVPSAYALPETIEAHSSIRWLHVREFTMVGMEKRPSEVWLECDESGRLKRFRYHTPNPGVTGPYTVVNDGNFSDCWAPNFNVCTRAASEAYFAAILCMQWDIAKTDPKLLCEEFHEKHRLGEVQLDIEEPAEKNEPIIVTGLSGGSKTVLYVDQATRLVNKIELFHHFSDGRDQHYRTVEFLDYNQRIDPKMFSLEGELPEDVIRIDLSDKEIGLAQGDMTDEQVAVELTRQFFEAIIAEDYDKAGLLYGGSPGFIIERLLMGAKLRQIVSLGQARREGNSSAMVSSCKCLLEIMGVKFEFDAHMVRTRPASSHPVRWVINGLGMSTKPYDGSALDTITLSQDRADPSAVTYDGLEAGEFMQKWLVLEPIPIEAYGDRPVPSEETQKREFDADYVSTTKFEPEVMIDQEVHRWSLLESIHSPINLTEEYADEYQTTYAWAQIDMPEARQGSLGIGSGDSVQVWLNGELVHENWICRTAIYDNDRVPVTFRKGMNQLVLKIQNRGSGWGFCCRLMEE